MVARGLSLAVFCAMGLSVPHGHLSAQSAPPSQAAASEPLGFDPVSIKPNESGTLPMRAQVTQSGHWILTNITLRYLVGRAYPDLLPSEITGGPNWVDTERFDLNAKIVGEVPPTLEARTAALLEPMRALIAERFKLKTHTESRSMSVYYLVRTQPGGALGEGLRAAPKDCWSDRGQFVGGVSLGAMSCGQFNGGMGRVSGRGLPLRAFLPYLSFASGRRVIDRTGLTGAFDIDLQFVPDPTLTGAPPGAGPAPALPDGPTLFTALSEQLGLKLEGGRENVPVVVIDSAERPTEN